MDTQVELESPPAGSPSPSAEQPRHHRRQQDVDEQPTSLQTSFIGRDDEVIPESVAPSPSTIRTALPSTSRLHAEWEASDVPMAKCDFCDARGRGRVWKCKECKLSICRTCSYDGRLGRDSRHTLNPDSVDWVAEAREKATKRKQVREPATGRAKARRGRTRGRAGRATTGRASSSMVSPQQDEDVQIQDQEASGTVAAIEQDRDSSPSSLESSSRVSSAGPVQEPFQPPRAGPPEQLVQYQHEPGQHSQPLPNPTTPTPERQQVFQRGPLPVPPSGNRQLPPPNRASLRHHPYSRSPLHAARTLRPPAPAKPNHFRQPVREPSVSVGPPNSLDHYRRTPSTPFSPAPPPPNLPISRIECPMVRDVRNEIIANVQASKEQYPNWDIHECFHSEVVRTWFRGHIRQVKETCQISALKILIAATCGAAVWLGVPSDTPARRWLQEKEMALAHPGVVMDSVVENLAGRLEHQ